MKKKKEPKIVRAAKWAKRNGYKYMSSVVKSHFNSVYVHVVPIDDVIKKGKWIPAPHTSFPSGARGRQGQINVPPKTVPKQWALTKVK